MKIVAAFLLCATLLAVALPARGADLMLLDEPRTNYRWYGLLFLGLSVGAFQVAQNGYAESDDALEKADAAYDLYKDAATAEDANKYHKRTNRYRREAVAYESTANAAVFIGTVLAITGVYCLIWEKDTSPILVSERSVGFQYRF